MAGKSDYLENKLIDHIFRARAFTAPTANWGVVTHFGLYDAASAGNL